MPHGIAAGKAFAITRSWALTRSRPSLPSPASGRGYERRDILCGVSAGLILPNGGRLSFRRSARPAPSVSQEPVRD